MKSPQHYDRFSLAYIDAVLGEAKKDEQILIRAHATLVRWKLQGSASPCHQEWCDLLQSDVETIKATVCIDTEFAAHLRKNAPFAAVLPEQQRLALIRQSETQ